MSNLYAQRVELLLKILPLVVQDESFAVHGGTAINLFVKNLLRYSVDIDLTYIPVEDRKTSLLNISNSLDKLRSNIQKTFTEIKVTYLPNISKLLCEYQNIQIKIEVNQIKRGIVCGNVEKMTLCDKAQKEFRVYCEANIVPLPLLYGGKISAALSRQHPRDMFDVKYMDLNLEEIKEGIIFCLLSANRPIHELLSPHIINQEDVMKSQFSGMTNERFTYQDYETTRLQLIENVNKILTDSDKQFLMSFEKGMPNWKNSRYEAFQNYPSIQWKLLNIRKLTIGNPIKLTEEANKLNKVFKL